MSDRTKVLLLPLIVIALLVPHGVRAQTGDIAVRAAVQDSPIVDVEIDADGLVRGVVLNRAGQPVADVAVEFHQHGHVVHARTDGAGQMAVPGLTGGSCLVKVGSTPYVCRLWKHTTAPPNAVRRFVVVDQDAPVSSVPTADGGFEMPADTAPLAAYNVQSKRHIALFSLLATGITAGLVIAAQNDAADASQ